MRVIDHSRIGVFGWVGSKKDKTSEKLINGGWGRKLTKYGHFK